MSKAIKKIVENRRFMVVSLSLEWWKYYFLGSGANPFVAAMPMD